MNSSVGAFTTLPNGDLAVGGNFTTAGSVSAAYIARLTTSCPATSASYGAGGTGSGGLNVLAPTTLPWIGGTFRATATGMPSLALVIAVTGFTPISIPLAAILPQGVPGNDLLVSSDLLDVLLPSGGMAQSQLALPNTLALVGQQFHQQVVPIEVDLALAFTAITSTNALTLTIGAFQPSARAERTTACAGCAVTAFSRPFPARDGPATQAGMGVTGQMRFRSCGSSRTKAPHEDQHTVLRRCSVEQPARPRHAFPDQPAVATDRFGGDGLGAAGAANPR